MRKLNPKHVEAVISMINEGPYFRLLSMRVVEMGTGYSFVEVNLERKHLNPFGGVHGGVYASLIDTAAYWSVYCELDENVGFISLDLKVDNLAPVQTGKLLVKGRRIKVGRSVCVAEGVITSPKGSVLARGTSILLARPGLQTINDLKVFTDSQSPPPKFMEK